MPKLAFPLIKKLDRLIIRSFIGPFIVTFFVTLFVLVMQFFWLYMDELIGKGLGIWMILQLLVYMSTTLVPLALPLGILLASIMTFGNMGENFELVAIKSAGISLLRFMRPLLTFIAVVGSLAFLFNNYVIPVANLKALSLLYDLRNSKPTLNIRAGQFNNDIPGYAIRVGEKDRDGKTIYNVIIYDHTSGVTNNKVVIANRGEMLPSPDKQYLIFRLQDGWRYEEGSDKYGNHNREQTRMHFKKWDKVFDLSVLRLTRTNEELFSGDQKMMDVWLLERKIDTLGKDRERSMQGVKVYLAPYLTFLSGQPAGKDLVRKIAEDKAPLRSYKKSFAELMASDSLRNQVVPFTTNNVRNAEQLLGISSNSFRLDNEKLMKFKVEWHRKFSLSFACVLLFLIGAPLGAIIRKGGLGMPLVVAVSFFLVWYIISIVGEKLSTSGSLEPWMGMWIATAMLLPIAFVLIRAARNDSQIFTKEWYLRLWNRLRGRVRTGKKP